jgi:hypothetical protein
VKRRSATPDPGRPSQHTGGQQYAQIHGPGGMRGSRGVGAQSRGKSGQCKARNLTHGNQASHAHSSAGNGQDHQRPLGSSTRTLSFINTSRGHPFNSMDRIRQLEQVTGLFFDSMVWA